MLCRFCQIDDFTKSTEQNVDFVKSTCKLDFNLSNS